MYDFYSSYIYYNTLAIPLAPAYVSIIWGNEQIKKQVNICHIFHIIPYILRYIKVLVHILIPVKLYL